MIKSELVNRIAAQNPRLYQRDIENLVNAMLGTIEAALCCAGETGSNSAASGYFRRASGAPMAAATQPPAPLWRSNKNPSRSSGPGRKCTSASIRWRRSAKVCEALSDSHKVRIWNIAPQRRRRTGIVGVTTRK